MELNAQRQCVASPRLPATGKITKLIHLAPEESCVGNERRSKDGYGIIRGHDGRDIYFVNTAVKGCHFDDLAVGQVVEFTMEEGPLRRATSVSLVA